MGRRRALSAREVDAIRNEGMHWVADNLYLQIWPQGTRSWLFRYWVEGKPKVIGLGAVRDVPLAKAKGSGRAAAHRDSGRGRSVGRRSWDTALEIILRHGTVP